MGGRSQSGSNMHLESNTQPHANQPLAPTLPPQGPTPTSENSGDGKGKGSTWGYGKGYGKSNGKGNKGGKGTRGPVGGCWLCGGGHYAKFCRANKNQNKRPREDKEKEADTNPKNKRRGGPAPFVEIYFNQNSLNLYFHYIFFLVEAPLISLSSLHLQVGSR